MDALSNATGKEVILLRLGERELVPRDALGCVGKEHGSWSEAARLELLKAVKPIDVVVHGHAVEN